MKTNIALIGFMGTGKSAAGALLAKRTGKRLVEVDSLIEAGAGKPVSRIFREDGEQAFREQEIEVIREIASRDDQVISCGGGAVLNSINIDRLKASSVIVWLTASPEVIAKRTRLDGEIRPVLKTISGPEELQALIRLREPFYEQAADIKIDTSHLDLNETAEEIIHAVRKFNADNDIRK